jgi:hypothetical protein
MDRDAAFAEGGRHVGGGARKARVDVLSLWKRLPSLSCT